MIPIGRLGLGDDRAVVTARRKLLRLGRALGLDAIGATRLATAGSAAGRALARSGRDGAVEIGLIPGSGSAELVLRFSGADDLRLDRLTPFFDRVSTHSDAQEARIRFAAGVLDNAFLDEQRRLLGERSRSELMSDIQRHNRDLEGKVAERTDAFRRAQSEAERASQAKSDFLSNMSHELRTPLNGVLGYAQILLRDPAMGTDQRASLDAIQNCGRHLLTLINDVLDLSKIEAGRLEIDLAPCRLRSLITAVKDMTRPRAAKQGLAFELEVDDSLPEGIETDETKLRQVLVNLLGNAVKFTERGSVRLIVAQVGTDHFSFAVEDTGIGMTPDEVAHIFDPFKQAEGGKVSGGTGLGLAISQRISEALGGTLEVESEKGRGSRFIITLPLRAVALDASLDETLDSLGEDRPRRLPDGVSRSVLIADDHPANRDILARLLGDAGFQTRQAADGREAIESLRSEGADVVLMDIRMPGMDGHEATREIRADDALRSAVVIAVSASVFPAFRQQLDEDGFDDFVPKPIRADHLFDALERHLNVALVDVAAALPAPEAEPTEEAGPMDAAAAATIGTRLLQAVTVGDIAELTVVAEQLAGGDAPERSVGEHLGGLVRSFDLAGVEALANSLTEGTENDG